MWRTLLFAFAAKGVLAQQQDVLQYVNPLIGTINGGHVFPGATLPFGMAKSVADVNGQNQGGFASDGSLITGFSHMHDSGTGGGSSFGNFPLFPLANCAGAVSACTFSYYSREVPPVAGSVIATPGYFAVNLTTGIMSEMTVANRTALYRFTFPSSTVLPLIMIGLEDLGKSYRSGGISVNTTTGRIMGSGTFTPSFGAGSYRSYFCADFVGATIHDVSVYSLNARGGANTTQISNPAGAYVRFNMPANHQVIVRVGLSFISSAQACANSQTERPKSDFGYTKTVAENTWRKKLGTIQVVSGGASTDLQTVFWSGVYRTLISPQDYTGENPLWNSTEPYYDSYYCIWDSFRSVHPLITLVDPYSQTLMVRSLIDIYRFAGKLPDCRMSLDKGFTQGGSNADIVLADALLKNITAGIDWNTAYAAVVSDAEVEPANWDIEGRGGIASWKKFGYIPKNDHDTLGTGTKTRSISRTVEYAYDDFCIAEMATILGKSSADAIKYFNSSNNWKNLIKADQTSAINGVDTGFKGFLQPKNYDGSWAYQDPIYCSPLLNFDSCYLNPQGHETYEGSCWLYTFFAPGDMAGLIKVLGGASTFTKRLDFLHESGVLYIGDEQAFLNVFLYHYAGRPGLSSKRAHYYIPSMFNNTLSGIPGNDDSGAMGSFAALTMMGIFPNPGQNVYFITPPFFQQVSILNKQTGKTATIKNINFDPSYKSIYIQNATLNGVPYTKNWLDHSFFFNGGVLELTLGSTESPNWGTGPGDLPPSLSTGGPHY